jgi:bifunctional UDP-N-acetylglucosamine pyrophosphorylase/glucosamine-1-phosphate N-acetyltransferase
MTLSVGVVILAGGQGSRLLGVKSKPLAPFIGKKLIDFPLDGVSKFLDKKGLKGEISIVTGHHREELEEYVKKKMCCREVNFAFQKESLGTGDALKSYFASLSETNKYDLTLVLCADTPLLKWEHFDKLYDEFRSGHYDAVMATFCADNPKGYGRIIKGEKGLFIIEESEADIHQKNIKEVNSGVYLFKTSYVFERLSLLKPRGQKGEYFLTDVFQLGDQVQPVLFENGDPFLGVNDLEQLEIVEKKFIKNKVSSLRKQGVRFFASESVYIEGDVSVGEGSVIHPNVMLFGKTKIGQNCVIETGNVVKNSVIENNITLKPYNHLDQSHVSSEAVVGPYANLRPGTEVGRSAKIGNFVEIKKASLGEGVKVSHLSYIGDAAIGDRTNIGCGFITCNYDGVNKHITKIGKDTFVGSDTQMIAPVEVGDGCFVASGSTIGESMPDGSFAIARSKQVTKKGMAKRFIKKS